MTRKPTAKPARKPAKAKAAPTVQASARAAFVAPKKAGSVARQAGDYVFQIGPTKLKPGQHMLKRGGQ